MTTALFPDLTVNGEAVPHKVVAAEAQNHSAPAGKPGIAWRKAARAVAIRTLLLQEARQSNIDPAPEDLGAGRRETDEEAQIRQLLDSEISVTPPSEDDIKTEWARDPERFRAPPLWEVSHILIACDPRDSDAAKAAEDKAGKILAQLQSAPRDFAKLAGDYSDCGSKASGGALGQLTPGDTVPEFERHLHDLPEGQITPAPIQTRFGWHIIRMDACAKGAVLPYEAARDKIADAMEKARWSEAAKTYVDGLVAKAEISGVSLTEAIP